MMSEHKRAHWEGIVRQLGKFEGEAAYVPYFWEQFLEGFADRDDGEVIGFDVTDEDKALFPELRHRRAVSLVENDVGFVIEVR